MRSMSTEPTRPFSKIHYNSGRRALEGPERHRCHHRAPRGYVYVDAAKASRDMSGEQICPRRREIIAAWHVVSPHGAEFHGRKRPVAFPWGTYRAPASAAIMALCAASLLPGRDGALAYIEASQGNLSHFNLEVYHT